MKYAQTKHQKDVNDVTLVFLLLTYILHLFLSVSIVGFEQVNVSWQHKYIFCNKLILL